MERKVVIYMKKTTLRRLFAAVVSIVMMLSICVVNVGAVPTFPTDGNNGTITVIKKDGSGYDVDGVEFSIKKVAQFHQYTDNGTTVLGFSLVDNVDTSTIFGTMTADYTDGETPVYKADTLQRALDNLKADGTYANNSWDSNKTTANGETEFTGLGFGIYLIDETDITGAAVDGEPVTVERATGPFLVALPQTSAEGTEWITDIELNAKNLLENELLEKTAYAADTDGSITETVKANASIGETYFYKISIDVFPTVSAGSQGYSEFSVTDAAEMGIDYGESSNTDGAAINQLDDLVVKLGDTALTKDTDYTLTYTEGGRTFTIALTGDGLTKLNAITANSEFTAEYKAHLNSDVVVTGDTANNTNEATLTVRHSNDPNVETYSDDAVVTTYDIVLTKTFADGSETPVPTDVIFELEDADHNVYKAIVTATGGSYTINDKLTAATAAADAQFTCAAVNESTNGTLTIHGLKNGTYTLTEMQTSDGYSLLKDPITITVADGNQNITVNNETQSIFTLPLTGGSGTWIYTVGGMALIGVAGVLLVTLGKKKTA